MFTQAGSLHSEFNDLGGLFSPLMNKSVERAAEVGICYGAVFAAVSSPTLAACI